ncbi:MAG: hypothetical protein P1Q69_01045 [Candidatus Thorarchaeota archaeon]|nr:hypothetical protein [Candidatus Thorarchaeota archaeon]
MNGMKSYVMTLIVAIVALIFPMLVGVEFDYIEGTTNMVIQAVFWITHVNGGSTIATFNFVYVIMRIVFIIQVYRYYEAKTTIRKALLVALLAELHILVVSILFYVFTITYFYPVTYLIITVPIPILFITGVILLAAISPSKTEEHDKWLTTP